MVEWWHPKMTNGGTRATTRTDCGRERWRPTKMTQTSSRVGQSVRKCVTPFERISISLIFHDSYRNAAAA